MEELIDDAYICLETEMIDAYGVQQHEQKIRRRHCESVRACIVVVIRAMLLIISP